MILQGRVSLAAVLLCGVVASPACGKKGPPLAPLIRIPAAVEQVSARRVGDDAYVTVTVPSQNVDASKPPDVARIEVYGATALTPPPRARFLEIGDLLDTVQVIVPVPGQVGDGVPPDGDGAVAPGSTVVVRDPLAPDDLVPRALPAVASRTRQVVVPTTAEPARALRRFYLALAFSDRGTPGPFGAIAELPLTSLPEAPLDVAIAYSGDTVSVEWEPSGGLFGFLMNRALPVELPPFDDFVPARDAADGLPGVAVPQPSPQTSGFSGPTRYNIYRELAPDPMSMPGPQSRSTSALRAAPPTPLNPAPVDALIFDDELEFERERCYIIRTVRGSAADLMEGQGSERRCVRPIDVFPPAAPTGLSAVAAEGSISLIWEASLDLDVAGYLILRGRSADDTLLPLTTIPVADTQFIDRGLAAGARYVYAVVAVDSRLPLPNVSPESARVEETAR